MHRKFIALILASSLAVAGLPAAPARAGDDTAKLLAGLAALALIGAAIERNRDRPSVSYTYTQPTRPKPHPHTKPKPKPTPPRITRLDLPAQCLRSRPVNGYQRNLVGVGCLKKNYAFNGTLPNACKLGYWDGRNRRAGYEPQCLRERGYRFARR